MKLKKLLALAMTSILLMSTMMMTASADEITIGGGTGTGVDKSVEVEEGVMTFTTTLNMSSTAVTAPTTDFEYTLTAGESVSNDVYPVTAGVLSGMTISYTASYTTTDIVTADGSIGEPITINFTAAKFTDPGIYVYELTATANTDAGIIMDANNTRYIYVYVENDETADGTGLVVSEIIMYTEAVYTATTYELPSDSTVKSAGFTNSYGVVASTDGAPGAAGGEATNNFIITATAGGTGADHNKELTYT